MSPHPIRRCSWLCIAAWAFILIAPAQCLHAAVIDRVVAVVNGDAITQSDLDMLAGLTRAPAAGDTLSAAEGARLSARKGAANIEGQRSAALDNLIDELLLKQAIEKSQIEVTSDELMRATQGILAQNGMTAEQLRSEVARKGMTYEHYQEQIRFEIKKIKFVNQVVSTEIKISDRDLRDYFDKNRARFHGGKQVHIAQIVLPIDGIATEEQAIALRNTAIAIALEAQKDPASFVRLARQYSQGPNAETGGDIGSVAIADLPQRVAAAVRNIPAGMVSDPIPTDHAVVIVKVINWPSVDEGDFEAVRDTIYQRLQDERLAEALNAYVQRLRQTAYIETR